MHDDAGSCSICSQIPDRLRANTGRGDSLPASTTPLVARKRHYSAVGTSTDLWECPKCARFYMYTTEAAFTGSGNNDDDTLERLSREDSTVVHAMLATRGKASELEDALFALPGIAFEEALWGAFNKSRDFIARFIPRLVREYAKHGQFSYGAHPTRDVLHSLVEQQPSFAREVLAAIATLPPDLYARLGDLEERCKKAKP